MSVDEQRVLTRGDWSRLRHREKEAMWLQIHGYSFDPALPDPITTVYDARRAFAPLLNAKDMRLRAMARRAYLAAEFEGRCRTDLLRLRRPDLAVEPCSNTVSDYRFLRLWEFNHVRDRATYGGFTISGGNCARRSWHVVRDHCLTDTVLLCRECHYYVTTLEKNIAIAAARQLLTNERT
jgi:hypothetical protein